MTGVTAAPSAPRIVFLDVDGTYAHHGEVPPAHARVVREARARGHRVLLCTGRPKAMLPEQLLAAGFDGIVASAGGYVEVDGVVLRDQRFPADLAARAIEVLDRHDAAYLLEAPDALYGRPGVDRRLGELLGGHFGRDDGGTDGAASPLEILKALRTPDDLGACSFAKITYFGAAIPWPELGAELGDRLGILPSSIAAMGDAAGEIYLVGVHKALGIEAVVEHLGVSREDVIAFGDGLNDLEMLEHAGTGVAIEGADPRVLAVADLVVPGPQVDGLVEGFARVGLV
ncbi:HAD hydrolase family protein [Cellulomonas sp. ACRRI]|uniref:HAD hydrolase family protein n=1 Tax=Cellulomonas sp. ACRRI TaxID=2918188 RepID=UPI001EF1802D|nr:HAD hydrolase family protein [Cellulomonas sp. ACRRI]MCG7284904.1 HAD hydrolase family protein [Cellulomonas sp. ACRRI]